MESIVNFDEVDEPEHFTDTLPADAHALQLPAIRSKGGKLTGVFPGMRLTKPVPPVQFRQSTLPLLAYAVPPTQHVVDTRVERLLLFLHAPTPVEAVMSIRKEAGSTVPALCVHATVMLGAAAMWRGRSNMRKLQALSNMRQPKQQM